MGPVVSRRLSKLNDINVALVQRAFPSQRINPSSASEFKIDTFPNLFYTLSLSHGRKNSLKPIHTIDSTSQNVQNTYNKAKKTSRRTGGKPAEMRKVIKLPQRETRILIQYSKNYGAKKTKRRLVSDFHSLIREYCIRFPLPPLFLP
jgi:hypothetical protein